MEVWCNTFIEFGNVLAVPRSCNFSIYLTSKQRKYQELKRSTSLSGPLFTFSSSAEVQLSTEIRHLTCLNPIVFVSHICFIFQKKGCSHFWQESLSSHWGAYKRAGDVSNQNSFPSYNHQGSLFQEPKVEFYLERCPGSVLDITTINCLEHSAKKV